MSQLDFTAVATLDAPALDTRRAAARAVTVDQAETIGGRILAYLAEAGPAGGTDEEITLALNLRHNSGPARRHELLMAGKILDSGKRRHTSAGHYAAVWILAGTKPISREMQDIEPCRRCRSTETIEVEISGGRIRLDCARCGFFVAWAKWWPRDAPPSRVLSGLTAGRPTWAPTTKMTHLLSSCSRPGTRATTWAN